MRARWVVGLLVLLVLPTAQPWGNGDPRSPDPDFVDYGVHDAIADLALGKLKAAEPDAARFLRHWYLPHPGGYGAAFSLLHLTPQGGDNFLGYTDDPDSSIQDWTNHLYYVHPRAGASDRGAPGRIAALERQLAFNLTLWVATGEVPCSPVEHMAAYDAGLLAHYVGDMSQFGHTDDTRKDHSHPAFDPQRRTYHGYYESLGWGPGALRALLADGRARPWQPRGVPDAARATVDLATRTNMPDGVTVAFTDTDGSTVQVGSQYRDLLAGFTSAYDRGAAYDGMRGWTPALWTRSADNVAGSVDLFADLVLQAWKDALAAVPVRAPVPLPGVPGCPAA